MTAARISDHNLFAAITGGSWLLLLILAAGGYLFVSPRFAAGVLAGGVLAISNFYWLRGSLRRLLQQPAVRAGGLARARYTFRYAVLGFAIYLLIVRIGIDPLGLLLGLSVLVIVISALALYMLKTKGE